jgi:hypothetical protein
MATSDGDVIMTDEPSTTTITTTAAPSQTESTLSQSTTRTDHDRNYYFLPTAPLLRSRVHTSQNLISLCGLDQVAIAVRRTDPVTGEKINKLRKSYEGIVKKLHLAGTNKPVVANGQWIDGTTEAPGLLDIPEEQWEQESVRGKAISQKSAADLLAKLDRAMTMAPGRLDDSDKWKKLLGDDVPKPKAAPVATIKAGGFAKASAQPSPKMGPMPRMQRSNAKRSYSDHSFSGYQDTFDADEDARDMTEDDARSQGPLKKKRRKVRR